MTQVRHRHIFKEDAVPIYEYKCTKCSECFEMKQSFSDKSTVPCHVCGAEAKRVFIPVPIVFKGPGFYVTDSAKEKEKAIDRTDIKKIAENSPKTDIKTGAVKTADTNN